jgi:lipid II:glycine glycyltransferase (peptidoglycan interpeptide bridge formation enzyme)
MDDEKIAWDSFVIESEGSFLQSFVWGDFQKSFGRKVWRLGDKKEGWQVQVFEYKLPFGWHYLYVPRGPVFQRLKNRQSRQNFRQALDATKKLAKKTGALFLKIEPEVLDVELIDVLNQAGFSRSTRQIQPMATVALDISQGEKELQAKFKPKTRYNVRVAIRHRVRLRQGRSTKDLDEFWQLLAETARRQRFRTHPKTYYQKMLSSGAAELFLIEHGKERAEGHHTFKTTKVVASALVNFFGQKATYLHGASSYAERNLMAPHYLHWRVIKEAKERGFKIYDFWGVDDKRFPGVSRFKQSWGGFEEELSGSWDFVMKSGQYKFYEFASQLKRKVSI